MKYIATVVLLLFISGCGLKPSIDDPKLSDAQLDLEKFWLVICSLWTISGCSWKCEPAFCSGYDW